MADNSESESQAKETVVSVSSLFVYPVKSCRRIEVDQVTVTASGLVGDRQWQISGGKAPTTQRQKAVLATVAPTPIDGGLRLSAPGNGSIEVATPTGADHTTGSIIGVTVKVGDAGDEVADWLGRVLGEEARLYAITDDEIEVPEGLARFSSTIGFPDVAPVHVTNTSSLDWLVERASESFDMHRFRPNIVVSGADPFAEDTWLQFKVGEAILSNGLPWPRCPIPQIDQEDASRHNEPAKILKTHRWCEAAPNLDPTFASIVGGSALFGIGAAIGPADTVIRLGDAVTIDAVQPRLIPLPAG